MAVQQAEIETIIKVHFYHGYASNLTIKDNPDSDLGFEIHYEEDNHKSSITGLHKEDLDQIIFALQRFKENQK
jgi:hypothetical protein